MKLRVTLFFLLIFFGSNAQDFQGFILYEYEFKDHDGKDITLAMSEIYGKQQHYYIDLNNYKSYNEKGELTQLYNSHDNVYYFRTGNQIKSFDGATPFPSKFKSEEGQEEEQVLEYSCKSVIVTSENGKTVYYFNDEVSVNPETFKNHRFGNWANYLFASKGALPLKFIYHHEDYIMTATAIKVERMKLKENGFDIEAILKVK